MRFRVQYDGWVGCGRTEVHAYGTYDMALGAWSVKPVVTKKVVVTA